MLLQLRADHSLIQSYVSIITELRFRSIGFYLKTYLSMPYPHPARIHLPRLFVPILDQGIHEKKTLEFGRDGMLSIEFARTTVSRYVVNSQNQFTPSYSINYDLTLMTTSFPPGSHDQFFSWTASGQP